MRPVYQTKFNYGEGDCFSACVASIFEVLLSAATMRPYPDDIVAWTQRNYPALEYVSIDLCTNYKAHEDRWTYDLADINTIAPPTRGYWIASVPSLRLKRPPSDPYYPMPALHAIVMRGAAQVHDPNPNYGTPNYSQIAASLYWVVSDPAKL